MAAAALADLEELALCSSCERRFDDAERAPKVLACKHHFCLACARSVLGKGRELACVHCWKRTALPGGRADALPTHAAVLTLARRLAAAPAPAPTTPWPAALLARDCRQLRLELRRLGARRRDHLLRALDAATALKLRLEAELAAPPPAAPADADARERDLLRARLADATLQARLDDLVRAAAEPLSPARVRRAVSAAATGAPARASPPAGERRDPLVFLANFCTARVYGLAEADADAEAAGGSPASGVGSPPPRAFPLLYFNVEVNGAAAGRVVIEVRDDVAPRMARNFTALATGELGVGYRGCAVFQCWENESVITGDFELNNGRGGRSVFPESWFVPEETGLAAVRGAVGMRRSQRRHDTLGLVGSQFRIVLREMRGFTAIFASVVDGLELVDRLAAAGDGAGKPHSAIVIASCGRLA